YDEESQPHPISYYGQTKYQGERVINLSAEKKAMIVRISYPYRAVFDKKKDFVRNVKSLLEQEKTLFMITDSLITPTFIDDIAYALKYLFDNFASEIFHLVGSDSLSPYEAGKLIAKTFNLNQSLIQPISYKEYFENRAKRPQYSGIKSKKNNFWKMKTFEEGLTVIKSQILNSKS
ncbi:MAG: SDR family oxidoreductase, partial [Microgenomates group bacterium]